MGQWTITNAKNFPLFQTGGSLPVMGSALLDWFQPMVFSRVNKSAVGYQAVEQVIPTNFRGVIMPLTARRLSLKPGGQRAWTWLWLFADVSLSLDTDEVIIYNGLQMRVMAKNDFTRYGYIEYELCQDWKAVGPNPAEPPYLNMSGAESFTNESEISYEADGGLATTETFDTILDGGNCYVD